MSELKDVIGYCFQAIIPPVSYMREKQFPNCAKVFGDISKSPPQPFLLGKTFCKLCRISGLAWIFWAYNLLVFTTGVVIVVSGWANERDFSKVFLYSLSCKQVLAALGSLLFVGWLFYFIARTLSLQLEDACRIHLIELQSYTKKKTSK